jgi:hypothetical protein
MFIGTAALTAVLAAPRIGVGQEKVAAPQTGAQPKPAAQLVPLKVQLVVSRHMGEKRIGSLPYTLWVTANKSGETSLRMGVQVPVVSAVFPAKEGAQVPVSSYSYRDVGTNIDCSATTVSDGWFNVNITLNDSAIRFDTKELQNQAVAGVPAFRNFTSRFSILLKDGQTAQYTSATDPVSGEVLKVDVTLTVLK